MKTTKEINQKLSKLIREANTLDDIHKRDDFEKVKWYSEEEINKAIDNNSYIEGFDVKQFMKECEKQ